MTQALSLVARSKGLPYLAAAAGVPRELLAAAMNRGEMGLDTLLAIMKVIDLHRPASGAPH
jgi:DNA-binding phage protein